MELFKPSKINIYKTEKASNSLVSKNGICKKEMMDKRRRILRQNNIL